MLKNLKWKRWTALALLVLFVLATAWYRGAGLVTCKIAGYDLDRDTDYSFITGACMIVNENGKKVYLKRLIGVDGTSSDVTAD